jgi:hypothetical protein
MPTDIYIPPCQPLSKPVRQLGKALSLNMDSLRTAKILNRLHCQNVSRLHALRASSAVSGDPRLLKYNALLHFIKQRHHTSPASRLFLVAVEYFFDDGCCKGAHGGALLFSHAVNTLFVVEAKILKDPPPAHAKVLLLKSIQNATKCSNRLSSWLPHLINMDLKDGTSLGCVPIRRMIVTAVNHGGRVFSQDIHSQLLQSAEQ